jgi:hypothetical protein
LNPKARWRCLDFRLSTPSLSFHRFLHCCWLKAKKPSNSWFQRPESPRSAPIDEGLTRQMS